MKGAFVTTFNHILHYQLFSVNQTPITILSVLVFVLVIATFFVLTQGIQRLSRNRILKRIALSTATQYTLIRISQYIVWVIGTIIAFQFIGINLSALANE